MLKREDYKAIQHMGRRELEKYMMDIYFEGYRAGVKVMADELQKQAASSAEMEGE